MQKPQVDSSRARRRWRLKCCGWRLEVIERSLALHQRGIGPELTRLVGGRLQFTSTDGQRLDCWRVAVCFTVTGDQLPAGASSVTAVSSWRAAMNECAGFRRPQVGPDSATIGEWGMSEHLQGRAGDCRREETATGTHRHERVVHGPIRVYSAGDE